MAQKFRKIGVLTSGGDAPGMSAAVRAVTRAANARGVQVMGIIGGYRGMIHDEMIELPNREVSNKIMLSGTFLYSDRCLEFKEEEGMQKAIATLKKHDIDGVIAIGGDGTFRGAPDLTNHGIPSIGLPGTIDNDITATDNTIGFDTAMNTVIELVDKLRDTCESHARCNVVEVMGRGAGWLTLRGGIAGAADVILIPEIPYDIDKVIDKIEERDANGSKFTIIAVAEGAISKEDAKLSKKEYKEKMKNYKYPSVSYEVAAKIQEKTGREVRVTVPGHMQRGGSPCPYDRVFASRLGAEAGKLILKDEYGFMVGYKNREIVKVPLEDVAGKLKMIDPDASIIKEAKLLGICFGD